MSGMKRGFLSKTKSKSESQQGDKHHTSASGFQKGFLQTKAPTKSKTQVSAAVSVPEKSSNAPQKTASQGFQRGFLNSTKKDGTTRANGGSLSTDNAGDVPQQSKERLSMKSGDKKAENASLNKKNASGFKKGFLTTSPKPTTFSSPTLPQASQDLLDIEEQPATIESRPSLLVLSDNNDAEDENHMTTNEETNRPLISILGGNDDAIRKRRPLIVSMDEDQNSSSEQVENDLSIQSSPLDAPLSQPLELELDGSNNMQEDQADEPLFTPIHTISRVEPIADESCSWSMTPLETKPRRLASNGVVLNGTSTMHSTSVEETPSQDLVVASAEEDGPIHSIDTTESPSSAAMDFLGFQTRLEDAKWRLTMSKGNEKYLIAREFAETLDSSTPQVSWTWEWIWREPTLTEAQTMGMAILSMTNHISSFWPYLEPSEDKQSRVVALQAVGLLRAYLEQQPVPHSLEWWTEGLPRLVALTNTNRRTVLAQKALLAGMELVGRAAEALVGDDETEENESTLKLHILWNKGAPLLDHLIGIQSVWKREASNISERALYKEWNRVYKQCASLSQHAMNGETSTASAWLWCRHVAGISIGPKESSEEKKGVSVSHFCHVGGIRQTLCSPKCSNLTTGDIVACLMAVLNSTKQADFDVDIFTRPTCRGMLALCRDAGKKKSDLTPEQRQDVVEICMRLLGQSVSADSVGLIMALLNCMWSESNGLPPDLVPNPSHNDNQTTVPASFEMLLDALKMYNGTNEGEDGSSSSKEQDLHPTSRALGALVARCIVASEAWPKLARVLVAKHGMRNSTIYVFESILAAGVVSTLPDNRNGQTGGTYDTVDEKNGRIQVDRELMQYVGELIIDHISSSVYLRARIRESAGALFGGCDVQWLAPKLILALANQSDGSLPTADAADYHDAIRTSLTSALERRIRHGSFDDFIHSIIHALEEVEDKQSSGDNQTKSNTDGLVGRLCSIFEGQWRHTLLQKSLWSDTDFGYLLLSIGKAMFAVPSSMTRLTLFGGVVGQNFAPETMGDMIVRDRILFAVTEIVKLCVEELDMADESEDVNALFHRLSPLLLLRRVPAIYFQIAWKHSRASGKGQDLYQALASLSRRVALRLDIVGNYSISVNRQSRVKYSAEERRLAAEIAGRCLPFGNPVDESLASHQSESCALFSCICLPAYTAALQEVSSICNPANFVESIRRARAALYATCHAIPMMQQKEYFKDDVLRLTAVFAFTIVAVDADEKDENLSNELVQLQTGCIEFFALCIERTLQDHVQSVETPSDSLVEVLHPESIHSKEENPVQPGFSTIEATRSICEVLVGILRFGRANDPWYFDDRSVSLIQHSKLIIDDFSVPARTCLWNAFVMASQRCQENEGQLALFAKLTVPWVIDWGVSGKNTDLHHPLCLAAALQVVFLLVTRTKCLNCFAEKGEDRKRNIRQAHRLALDSLKRDSPGGGAYATRALRVAGLKLLLALVTIDQINEDETVLPNCLGPGELGETFSVLHGVANMDADSEVQRLAVHILGSLKNS